MKRLAEWHPCLLAAAIPLLLYAHNASEAPLPLALSAMAVALVGTAVLLFLVRAVSRDAERAALFTSALVLAFYGYGHAFEHGATHKWFANHVVGHALMGTASVVLLALVGWLLKRTHKPLDSWLTLGLTLSGFITLSALFTAATGGERSTPGRAKVEELIAQSGGERPAPLTTEDAAHPDIYHIILDGYARNDVLASYYGYDNHEFTEELQRRGFFVADKSAANYPLTFMSLASTLSMRYLDEVLEALGPSKDRRAVYKLIEQPAVARTLQRRGYRYVHFNTNYGGTEHSEAADESISYLHPWLQSEFVSTLLRGTMLRALEPDVASLHLHTLAELVKLPALEGPVYTLCHILMPHNPYVFDQDGNVLADVALTLQFEVQHGAWSDKTGYVGQLRYVNKRILAAIDELLAQSKVPPVIVLHGDHGTASTYPKTKGDVDQLRTYARERMPILNAYFVPPAVKAKLYPEISPVNSFRVILSTLFGLELPTLPDRSYVTTYTRPYDLVDATDAVKLGPVTAAAP